MTVSNESKQGPEAPPPAESYSGAMRLLRVAAATVVCYFIGFTFVCWFLDFGGVGGKHGVQLRCRIFFDAGVISGIAALICSLGLWRTCRFLEIGRAHV